jgi:hypothetical protein
MDKTNGGKTETKVPKTLQGQINKEVNNYKRNSDKEGKP